MKSKTKLEIIILLIISIVLPFPRLVKNNIDDTVRIIYNEPKLKKSEIAEKIHIVGNDGWNAFKNAGNCSGEGTQSDPYIIKDLEIDNQGPEACILIENSNVYFKIENCNLGTNGYPPYHSIVLVNVDNSRIINNYCSNTISLTGSHYNMLVGNTISGDAHFYCTEQGSSCKKYMYYAGLGRRAIILFSSNNNDIRGNTLDYGAVGLSLSMSRNNTVLGNTIIQNYIAILCEYSDYNIITDNNLDESSYGIYLDGDDVKKCDYNIISENNIKIYITGVSLRHSNENQILGNYIDDKNGMKSAGEYGRDYCIYEHDSCSDNIFKDNKCCDSFFNLELILLISIISGVGIIIVIIGTILFLRRRKKARNQTLKE